MTANSCGMTRLLTPAENAAITAQCIRRVYDEHDREDEGRAVTK